jgi:TolB-like protein/tetratricopeptide (TPR) repeat protein
VVRDQVRDKLDFSFTDMGEQQVKNIARPVRAHRILVGAEAVAPVGAADAITASARPAAQKPSIAVLPFANMSGDAEQEYFSEGITEDIITNLSRNRAFFVISRSTSFTYKGPAVDVGKVARELGVRYVVEGSVRRAGNRVRITAQLIDAGTGHHLWADRYDRELADVFAVQDEIAQSIAGAIVPGIISAEIRHAQLKDPGQLGAWDRTVRAHWHIRRFTQSDLAEARRLLEEAVALDPTNSMALADLALARHFEAVFGWGDGPAESHLRLGEAARKAVAADDNDAMAHTSLAIFDLFSGRHEEARRRLHRALDLDPNSMFARGYLGISYAFSGDYDAALTSAAEAMRLSPRGPLLIIWHLCKGWAALLAGRDEEAVEYATQAAEANPEFPDIYAVLASANGHLGKGVPARAALDQLSRRLPALTIGDERLNGRSHARAIGSASLRAYARRVYPRGNPGRKSSSFERLLGRTSPFQGRARRSGIGAMPSLIGPTVAWSRPRLQPWPPSKTRRCHCGNSSTGFIAAPEVASAAARLMSPKS